MSSDDLALKLQSKGAEVTRTLKDGQTAEFIVVDVAFVTANPNDNLDLYYLQPEWWRVYKPALVTELLSGGLHTVRALCFARLLKHAP